VRRCQYISKDVSITRFLHQLFLSVFSKYLDFVGFQIGFYDQKLKSSFKNKSVN